VIVVCAAVWFGRVHFELEASRKAAAERSKAVAAGAQFRQQKAHAVESNDLHYITEAEADRQIAAARGAYQDNAIHRCVSESTDTYQLGPCRSPLMEAGYARVDSYQQSLAEQARIRREGEARLLAEQQRFAALTGQPSASWQSGYASSFGESPRQRCARVKAERDEAYRLAGNDRSFDFSRSWDNAVYEACKDT
jgi:hypothetical protein